MTNPQYATVMDYATYGGIIVTAYHQADAGLSLTGFVVDVESEYTQLITRGLTASETVIDNWADIDALEAAYRRVTVTTTDGEDVYMYAAKENL